MGKHRETIQQGDRVIRLKPYQDQFIFSKARYPALVSAWGTGKTMCGIEKVKLACEGHAGNLILVVRKEFTDLKDSTIKDWNENTGIIVDSGRDARFSNNSVVMFRHAGELTGDNLNNMNLGGFLLEQGEELDNDEAFFKLQGRLRRFGVRHFGAVIANTKGHNWIYKLWKSRQDVDYPLYEATSFDNEDILPKATIKDWRKLALLKPKIYNRFVMNSWEESDTVDLIIQPSWVEACVGYEVAVRSPIRRVVSIDVARGGMDKSIFYALEMGGAEKFENYRSMAFEEHSTRNTMELVGRAGLFAKKHKIKAFAVDEIGVGGGVADRLKELGNEVIFVNAAERDCPEGWFNRRAEILGFGAKLFEERRVSILKEDTDLKEQLSWTHWLPMKSSGVLQAESKDKVRENFSRSPDNADAFLNGLWALDKVLVSRQDRNDALGWNDKSYEPVHPSVRTNDFVELYH